MKKKLIMIAVGAVIIIPFFMNFKKNKESNISVPLINKNETVSYSPGDHEFVLFQGDLKRKYIVHYPNLAVKSGKNPLIIALHGGLGSAEGAPGYFELNPKSDQEGFVVVYPEGTGTDILGKHLGSWNAGKCCPPASTNYVDDVGFIDTMIERMKKDFNIDGKRVYVTGFSNGGIMAYRLACDLSQKIAAIAPGGAQGAFDSCNPVRKVPVIHIHGKLDRCGTYAGGKCGGCAAEYLQYMGVNIKNKAIWNCPSVPDYVAEWAKRNGCSNETDVVYQNGGAQCVAYRNCAGRADVQLCSVEGQGHTWPGRTTYGAEPCDMNPNGRLCTIWKNGAGPLSQDLIANDVIWEFFKNHPMP